MMTPDQKAIASRQAALDMAITQRNANANDVIQMAADMAVLRAENKELAERIAALELKVKPNSRKEKP